MIRGSFLNYVSVASSYMHVLGTRIRDGGNGTVSQISMNSILDTSFIIGLLAGLWLGKCQSEDTFERFSVIGFADLHCHLGQHPAAILKG